MRITLVLALAASTLAFPAVAQTASDVIIMRRAIAPPRIADAPSHQAGEWKEGVWAYETTSPQCTDAARRVRTVTCESGGLTVDGSRCAGTRPATLDTSTGRYDGCQTMWAVSYGNWSSTCAVKATRTVTSACTRYGGNSAPVPTGNDALCTSAKPSSPEEGEVTSSCTYAWRVTGQGPWSNTCGVARTRTVTSECYRSDNTVAKDQGSCTGTRPAATEADTTNGSCDPLVNGDFDNGRAPWGAAFNAVGVEATGGQDGGPYLRLTYNGGGARSGQTITVTPGANYSITAWAKINDSNLAANIIIDGNVHTVGTLSTGQWSPFQVTVTAQRGTMSIALDAGSMRGNPVGFVDFDKVTVTPVN